MARKLANWATVSVGVALLCGAFASFGAPEAGPVVPETWKAMDAKGLVAEAVRLRANKAAMREREALADYVAERFFVDRTTTRSVGCRAWRGFVNMLQGDLDADEQTLWEEKLHDAFADTENAIAGLNAEDFGSLTGALGALKSDRVRAGGDVGDEDGTLEVSGNNELSALGEPCDQSGLSGGDGPDRGVRQGEALCQPGGHALSGAGALAELDDGHRRQAQERRGPSLLGRQDL